jgi:hypothetical protein
MNARRIAAETQARQKVMTKEAADAARRSRALQASGERAQTRADKLCAVRVNRGRGN